MGQGIYLLLSLLSIYSRTHWCSQRFLQGLRVEIGLYVITELPHIIMMIYFYKCLIISISITQQKNAFSSTVISILFLSLPYNLSTSIPLSFVSFFFCLSEHFSVCSNFWFASLGWNLDLARPAVPFAKTIRNHDVNVDMKRQWYASEWTLNKTKEQWSLSPDSHGFLPFQTGDNKFHLTYLHDTAFAVARISNCTFLPDSVESV